MEGFRVEGMWVLGLGSPWSLGLIGFNYGLWVQRALGLNGV